MADGGKGFDAGSIFVALKAQISDLEKGLTKAKGLLGQFGDKAEEAGAQVSHSGQGMATQFDKTDRQTLKFTERLARFTNRLVSLQFAINSFGATSKDSFGTASRVAEAAQASMTAFAASVSLLPNKLGVALGGITAVALGVQTLARSVEDFKKFMDQSVVDATEWGLRMREGLGKELVIINSIGNAFGKTELEKFKDRLEATKKEIESLIRFAEVDGPARIRQLMEMQRAGKVDSGVIDKIMTTLERGAANLGLAPGTSKDIIGLGISDAIDQVLERQREAVAKAGELAAGPLKGFLAQVVEREFQLAQDKAKKEGSQLVLDITAELKALESKSELLIRQGLSTPLEAAEQRARATAGALEELFRKQLELEKLRPGLGQELDSEISTAIGRAKKQKDIRDRMFEIDRQAHNFGGAVGAGLREGILTEGTSALEALSMVGANLFENFVNDTMTQLQKGLSTAFTKIIGEAGVGFASMLTGVLGLIGMLMSRGKGRSSDSFDATRNLVESTQPFRGIVAGNANVSIAAVGEDLQRSLVPTNGILSEILFEIRSQRRGGQGPQAAGGFAFVAAPTT